MKEQALAQLFPEGVVVEVATPGDEDESLLDARELALMTAMTPARRKEFTAGRNAARRALQRIGVRSAPLLRIGDSRDVAWPEGSTGSISHTSGLYAVACASTFRFRSIGLDVEQAGPLESEIIPTICLPVELAAVATLPSPGTSGWPRLLFAMKEAAYKALFPVTRQVIDFHDMEVRISGVARDFEADVSGRLLQGRYGWDDTHVYAGAWYPPQ